MTPNEVFFGLITAAIVALVIVLIWLCVRLGETVRAIRGFVDTTQQPLQESLRELNENLRTLRTLTNNINVAADNVTTFTGSVRDVGDSVKQIAGNVRQVGDIVRELGIEILASVHGVRSGLKAGFGVFLKNLISPGATR